MYFDLIELRRVVGEALSAVETGTAAPDAAHTDLTFESVEVYARTATLSASLNVSQRRILLRVAGDALTQAAERKRFNDEVGRAREISAHPSVARLLDAGVTELGYPFVIQLFDQDTIQYSLPLPVEKVIGIGAKLADALCYAHNLGAELGDVGPSHVLMAADGEPVLTMPNLPMFVSSGSIGSAPERDVYALCATLLSMLAEPHRTEGKPEARNVLTAQARSLLLSGTHAQPQLRPSAPVLRDRLHTLRMDVTPIQDDMNMLARFTVRSRTSSSETEILVRTGDLFSEQADVVVGFSDTFDTATDGGVIISKSSLQGQLVERMYDGSTDALDRDLDYALASERAESFEARSAKSLGKLGRYPIGTVVVLGRDERWIFAVAISRMGNDLIARSSYEFLQRSLARLWAEIRSQGSGRTVAMPIIGSGLSRVDANRDSLLRQIISSFKEHTQIAPICQELRIVVHPSDLESVDILGVTSSALGLASS